MISSGDGIIIPSGSLLLALEDSVTLYGNNVEYLSTRCLWINAGEIVYNVSNIQTLGHSKNYRMINDKAFKETALV